VGKSRAAAALAGRYGVPVAEADDTRTRPFRDGPRRGRHRVRGGPTRGQLDRIDSALRGAYLAAGAPPSTW